MQPNFKQHSELVICMDVFSCSNFKMFGILPAWKSLSKFSFEFWPNPTILGFNVEI